MCLMVTADHGPAVSGAHNTIVTARAGKDLVSCLTSGLLTIVRKYCVLYALHVTDDVPCTHLHKHSIAHYICYTMTHAWRVIPTLLVTPVQLMRPGIGWNTSYTLGCLTSRPNGPLQPKELWFLIFLCASTISSNCLLHLFIYIIHVRYPCFLFPLIWPPGR